MQRQHFFDVMWVIVTLNMGIFVVVPALILTPMPLTHPTVMLQTGLVLATAVFVAFALKRNVV